MRCNTGINPYLLADQHLCELSELKMVPGTLVRIDFIPKSSIPKKFKLNSGHINFFYDKLNYLEKRHKAVYAECLRRGRNGLNEFYQKDKIPDRFWKDWMPTMEDSMIVRERIYQKLLAKSNYWRYEGSVISDIKAFAQTIMDSPLHYV